MCTKNHNNMRYSSWDKGWDRQNFLSFLSFYLTYNLKNENFEKMKHLEVSFYTSAPKIMIICYTVPKIWHVMDVYNYFPFSAILCNFIPLRAPKNKIFKKLKKHLVMFIKIMIRWCTVPEILSEQTVTKWHIEVRALFKKINVKLWRKQKNEDYKAKDKIRRVKVAIFNF